MPKAEGQGLVLPKPRRRKDLCSHAYSGESYLCDFTFFPQLCALKTLRGVWRKLPRKGGRLPGS